MLTRPPSPDSLKLRAMQKGNVEALFEVQSWITIALKPQAQHILSELHTPPDTLRHALALR